MNDGRAPYVDVISFPRRGCSQFHFVGVELAPHVADVGEEPRRRAAAAGVFCSKSTYTARRQPDALLKGVRRSVARPCDNLTVHGFSQAFCGWHRQLLTFLLPAWREGVLPVNFGCRPAEFSGHGSSNALTEPWCSPSPTFPTSLSTARSACMETDADRTREPRVPRSGRGGSKNGRGGPLWTPPRGRWCSCRSSWAAPWWRTTIRC